MNDDKEIKINRFIEKLYNSRSSTPQDKERIVKLLLSERGKGFVTEERVKEILKEELFQDSAPLPKKKDALEGITYYSPKYLSDFLEEYNKDYPILKYTCHTIDSTDVIDDICNECNTETYDFDKHQKLILQHFNKLVNQYSFIDNKLKSMIYGYITGKNTKGITVKWASVFSDSWGSDNVREWASANPGKVPNPGQNIQFQQQYEACPLSRKYSSPLTGEPIIGFDDLVLCFKSLFHVKKDNNLEDILSLVEEETTQKRPGTTFVRTNFHTEIELFTNVQALQRAYKKIIDICMSCGRGERIETSFYESSSHSICFTITDVGSVFGKTVNGLLDRPGDRLYDLINSQINGMCDLYIIADFHDGLSYKINLWDRIPKRVANPVNKVNGVQYLLEFKKSQS